MIEKNPQKLLDAIDECDQQLQVITRELPTATNPIIREVCERYIQMVHIRRDSTLADLHNALRADDEEGDDLLEHPGHPDNYGDR